MLGILPPTPKGQRQAQRMEELLKAPDSQVHAILRALCDDVTTRKKAVGLFDKLQTKTDTAGALQESLQICIQCEQPFTSQENGPRACKYHSGRLMLDHSSEVWADTDDWMFDGIEDDPDMQEENPEGFQYNCCDRSLKDAVPCTISRHEADPSAARKDTDASLDSDGEILEISEDEDLDEDGEDEEDDEDKGPPRKKRVM